MPVLKIPKKQMEALEGLAKLSEKTLDELIQAISSTPPTLKPESFCKRVSSKVSTIDQDECSALVDAIVGLSFIREKGKKTIPQLVEDLTSSLSEEKTPAFGRGELEVFKTRLTKFISMDSVVITASALGVMTDYERIYCGGGIQSDMRVVFVGSEDRAAAGIVVHNLNVHYHQDRDHKEFYVALDSDDLIALKEEISKAEQREKKLKAAFKKAEIHPLGLE